MEKIFDLRSIRQEIGLGQRELAELIDIDLSELMRIERGFSPLDNVLKSKISNKLNDKGIEDKYFLEKYADRLCGEGYVTSKPKGSRTYFRKVDVSTTRLPIIDLFCGVGGFSSGFEQTGKFEVVAGIDLLGDRLDTFVANHGAANAYGEDIRKIHVDSLAMENPAPFVVVGGPPCQGFSSIRPFRNVDWNDPRNNLAEEFCRIVGALQPEWIVFENVVGLLTHEGGRTFKAIEGAFGDLGYRTDARVLNAANYGLPQRRERLILVGSRKGKRFKWPEPTHEVKARSMAGNIPLLMKPTKGTSDSLRPCVTVDDAIGDLPPIQSGQSAASYGDLPATDYGVYIRNGATRLVLHEATRHSPKMLEIIRHSGANIHALPPGMVTSGFSSCYSRLSGDEPSVTLTVNFVHPASNRCIHPHQDRALTPREGARLQGFFDNFEFSGSRAQIVKQIGNAVPPPLGKVIATAILESD